MLFCFTVSKRKVFRSAQKARCFTGLCVGLIIVPWFKHLKPGTRHTHTRTTTAHKSEINSQNRLSTLLTAVEFVYSTYSHVTPIIRNETSVGLAVCTQIEVPKHRDVYMWTDMCTCSFSGFLFWVVLTERGGVGIFFLKSREYKTLSSIFELSL